jgi:dihydroorotate dehydrogenase (NAD+) catalytic subunit
MNTTVQVGLVTLSNPVMTASGTAGHGCELSPYGNLADLGAFVVKSLAAFAWQGNPPPRVHPTPQGMINAVGLQGPGVDAWIRDDLPALVAAGASVVASIWGRSVAEY